MARLQSLLEEVSEATLPFRPPSRGSRKPNAWWSQEIAEARRASFRARRWFQRRRKKGAPDAEEARGAYALSKKVVQLRIWRAKEALWKELHSLVDSDPWGRPYKVVMATLKGHSPRTIMTPSQVRHILEELFVTSPPAALPPRPTPGSVMNWVSRGSVDDVVNAVDEALIGEAASRIKPAKAPGLDAVPSQVVACILRAHLDHFGEMVRDTLRRGSIPPSWKRARVVLIPKPGKDPGLPSAYRPISILPALSKAWEYAIKGLIERFIGQDAFHPSQFGFRKGVETVDAAAEVTRIAHGRSKKNRLCAMVTIDVRNAFNTLSWDLILEELGVRGVPQVIRTLLGDYFSDRVVVVHNEEEHVEMGVRAGVPQGSVIGPFLWNLVYDDLLALFDSDRHILPVAYVDDLALVFSSREFEHLEEMISVTMTRVDAWFRRSGLQVASAKTEVILLTGRKGNKVLPFEVLGSRVMSAEVIKYLGIMLDCRRSFKVHLREAAARGDRIMGALASLLPNIGGPSVLARRLYYSVWESVVLYAAPVWATALEYEVKGGHSGKNELPVILQIKI